MMRITMMPLVAVFALLPLAAQAETPAAKVSERTVPERMVYSCADDQELQVVFADNAAIILQKDRLFVLEQVRSASGAVFRSVGPDDHYVLSTKGQQAFLEAGDDLVLKDCTAAD